MKLIDRAVQEFTNLEYTLRVYFSPIPESVEYTVPYVCQFAVPESAELSLTKKLDPADDPNWSETGATSRDRYAEWAFTMCGMASLAMALGYFKNLQLKPAALAEDALKHGVYLEDVDGLSAMRYAEFAKWVGQKFNMRADIYTRLSLKGIEYALSKKNLVIVSVNPNIRGYNTAPQDQKGGHLVLVTGYDHNEKTISLNNPSGFVSTDTQINHTLPIREFKQFYAGRGIVIAPMN